MCKIVLLTLFISLMTITSPARAQDTRSPDDLVLVDRAITAIDRIASYQQYIAVQDIQQDRRIVLKSGDTIVQQTARSLTSLATMTIIRGDAGSGARQVEFSEQIDDGIVTLEGEVRAVDGVLYGRLQAPITGNQLLEWQVVDESNTDLFDVLSPADLFDLLAGDLDVLLRDADRIAEFMTAVDHTESNVDDESVEVITLHLDARALSAFISETRADAPDAMLFGFLNPASRQQIDVYLDDALRPIRLDVTLIVDVTDAPSSIIVDDAPAGSTIDFQVNNVTSTLFSYINECIDPIVAPF